MFAFSIDTRGEYYLEERCNFEKMLCNFHSFIFLLTNIHPWHQRLHPEPDHRLWRSRTVRIELSVTSVCAGHVLDLWPARQLPLLLPPDALRLLHQRHPLHPHRGQHQLRHFHHKLRSNTMLDIVALWERNRCFEGEISERICLSYFEFGKY